MFAGFAAYGKTACSVGTGGETALDGFADGLVLVLYGVAGGYAGGVVFGAIGRDVGEEEVKNDAAFAGADRQDEVGVHYAVVDIEHEVGIEPVVPGTISSTCD